MKQETARAAEMRKLLAEFARSGLGLTNQTGPNGTSVDIGYDTNARPTSSTSPFGATTSTAYTDSSSGSTCTMVDNRWTQTNLDGLGRPVLILTGHGSSCGAGTILTQAETAYAPCGCSPLGKLNQQWMPHSYGTNKNTAATTTYTYDGIGRTVSKAVVGPVSGTDTQGTINYVYQGNMVQVTDPAGKIKQFTTDAFGNLVQVVEDPSVLDYTTSYTYDVLNHLVGVSMPRSTGTQTRSWSYTGNFLMSATNPENGTTSYAYGSNNKISQRTDAKGQVTTYTYDGYARLSEVQRYPSGLSGGADPCQQENYYYDGYNPLSSSYPHYALGRLSAVQYWGGYNPLTSPTCDTVFTEMYNYGVPGSPVGKQLTVSRGGVSFALAATYTYDTEGRMSAETYPTDNSGTTSSLSYTFDSMGRLNTMTDALAMQTIIAGASYGPANEITGITGATGGWAGESRTYNSLKQLTGISAGAVSVTYAYPSTQNNGKISSETDGGYSGEVITYTYDSLNRLITASDQPTWPFSWGQSYGYDGFGNLTSATVTQGTAPAFTQSYDVNNHAGGEDANGNPGNVPLPAYGTSKAATYDVENRLVAIAGTSSNPTAYYSYDPSNKRVWRGNWAYSGSWARTEDEITFWSVNGQKLATYNVTQYGATLYATQSGTNYYFGAKLIKNASGWVYSNRLGSIGTFFPYGQERPSATTNNTEKFTGYFRDAETGNDYAVNRYTSPGYGRFVTPDRMTGDPADPASWNKYAYTEGDPINGVDQEGLYTCGIPGGSSSSGGIPPTFPFPPIGGGDGVEADFSVRKCDPGGRILRTDGTSSGNVTITPGSYTNTGANVGKITSDLRELVTLLSTYTQCANWLNTGTQNVFDEINGLIAAGVYGTAVYNSELTYATTSGKNGAGQEILPPGVAFAININGAFFAAFNNGKQLPSIGSYNAGTPQIQAAILIHELAHLLDVPKFSSDMGNARAVKNNDQQVANNCGKLIGVFQ